MAKSGSSFTAPVSAKVSAATIASAVSLLFWVLMNHFVFKSFSKGELTALEGATTTVLVFVVSWLTSERSKYIAWWHQQHKESPQPTPGAQDA